MKRFMISAGQVRRSSQRCRRLQSADGPAGCALVLMASTAIIPADCPLLLLCRAPQCSRMPSALTKIQSQSSPDVLIHIIPLNQVACSQKVHEGERGSIYTAGSDAAQVAVATQRLGQGPAWLACASAVSWHC